MRTDCGHRRKARAVEADVSNPEQVEALVAATVRFYGGIDILVNNAGIEQKHPFLEMPYDLFRKIIDIDLAGVWLCSQIAAREMVRHHPKKHGQSGDRNEFTRRLAQRECEIIIVWPSCTSPNNWLRRASPSRIPFSRFVFRTTA